MSAKDGRITQREMILEALRAGQEVGVNTLELRNIAPQYNARIYELRHKEGYTIELYQRDPDGVCWYRLVE